MDNDREITARYNATMTRGLHVIGTFFVVVGVLNLVTGVVALIAVLATGLDAEGVAIIVMFLGAGVAWSMVGWGMRRMTF